MTRRSYTIAKAVIFPAALIAGVAIALYGTYLDNEAYRVECWTENHGSIQP